MPHFLIALHGAANGSPTPSMSEDDMRTYMERIGALHEEMRAAGAWVFSGALGDPDDSTVVRDENGEVVTMDGPFIETKEQLAGFYVVEVVDRDEALAWAAKATAVVGKPLEVRAFRQSEA